MTAVRAYSLGGYQIRAVPAGLVDGSGSNQRWFEEAMRYRWNQARKLTDRLASGKLSPDEWADAFDAMLVEAHTNAWWIGRTIGGKAGDPTDEDFAAGRSFADADADYVASFLDDIRLGRYDDEDGNLRIDLVNQRVKLYVLKSRGTANAGTVDAVPLETEIRWLLGAVAEEHCIECPQIADLSPFTKATLFTTPGACDTPCLGHCECHLDFVIGGQTVSGVKPVKL